MRSLSERQRQVLDFIRGYVRDSGVVPSRPEIATALGLKHKSTVDAHLLALMNKGWIELRPGSPRNIRLLREEVPLAVAGPIAAGKPILANERIAAQVPRAVAEMFSPRPDFFLRVEGDSMNRLGLVTGTLVAVQSRAEAVHRDVVVARIDDEVTLKRFIRVSDRYVELRPESTNPRHRPIRVDLETGDLAVAGVAVGALIGDGFNRTESTWWST
jgi:repressor LexA